MLFTLLIGCEYNNLLFIVRAYIIKPAEDLWQVRIKPHCLLDTMPVSSYDNETKSLQQAQYNIAPLFTPR